MKINSEKIISKILMHNIEALIPNIVLNKNQYMAVIGDRLKS